MRSTFLCLILILLFPFILFAAPAKIPQTGQNTCYDAAGSVIACSGTGQDGDVQAGVAWPDPRFNDNLDGTVSDNLTGLIWAQDATTPATSTCASGTKSWQGALDYVACLNTENYLGYNDWILPNVVELKSLVDAEQTYYPALPSSHPFTGVQSLYYWSSSTVASFTGYAWIVGMGSGDVNLNIKTSNFYVWPVRGGQSTLTLALPKTGQTASYATDDDGELQRGVAAPSLRFTDNGDGTVTDNLTGLTWLSDTNCTETVAGIDRSLGYLNWNNGLTWSNGLASGSCGLSDNSVAGDWRLPNARELASLEDYAKINPALSSGYETFFTGVQSDFYWTSSTYASNTSFAWGVDMNYGYVFSIVKANDYYVWPVRGGQPTLTFAVSPSAASNGSMSPATVQIVEEGLTTSFTITPDAGYMIYSVSGCGGSLAGSTYTTGSITGDCTVMASFVELDTDDDGIVDGVDNCPNIANPDQTDIDADGIGDTCDTDDDNDGFTDMEEVACGSDPTDPLSRCSASLPWLMLLLD